MASFTCVSDGASVGTRFGAIVGGSAGAGASVLAGLGLRDMNKLDASLAGGLEDSVLG